MSLKGAIFDLDGVIVNTVPLHFKAWEKMFKQHGHAFTMQDYLAKVDGRPRLEGAAAILTDFSEEEIVKAGNQKQAYFVEYLESEPIEKFESTIALLNEFKKRSIKLAAASSSKNARRILKKIGLYDMFEVDVSGADFEKGKPDPEIFLTAAKRMGLTPIDCIVFEDAKSGVDAARAGSFKCIGINRHHNALALANADKIVNDLAEITIDEIYKMMEER